MADVGFEFWHLPLLYAPAASEIGEDEGGAGGGGSDGLMGIREEDGCVDAGELEENGSVERDRPL